MAALTRARLDRDDALMPKSYPLAAALAAALTILYRTHGIGDTNSLFV
jgi:hypothetical protein